MFFTSDNASGAAPEIIAALARANDGFARSYGADDIMVRVTQQVRRVFDHPEAAVYLVSTGTAANALALALYAQPWSAVFAHTDAHIAQAADWWLSKSKAAAHRWFTRAPPRSPRLSNRSAACSWAVTASRLKIF